MSSIEITSVPEARLKIKGQVVSKDIISYLVKVKASISSDAVDMARIVFNDTPDCALQKLSIFNVGNSISVELGYSQKFKTVFTGEIFRIDYSFSAKNSNKIELICYDKLFKLSMIKHIRSFEKQKDSDIAKKLAKEAGLKVASKSIDTTQKKVEYLFQNNQSNLDFLRMRAEAIGYEVSVDDDLFTFKKAKYQKPVKGPVLNWEKDLIEFSAKIDVTNVVKEVVVTSWNPESKKQLVHGKSNRVKKVANHKVPATTALRSIEGQQRRVKGAGIGGMGEYILDKPNQTRASVRNAAQATLAKRNMDFLTGSGVAVGNPEISASKIIEIKNVGNKISGSYYIVACEHVFDKSGYKTYFEGKNNGFF